MTQRVTNDAIQQIVARAIEQATANSGGPRLVPFTAAELRFIQQVVAQSLQEVLATPSSRR
jgi:hypothetical protein